MGSEPWQLSAPASPRQVSKGQAAPGRGPRGRGLLLLAAPAPGVPLSGVSAWGLARTRRCDRGSPAGASQKPPATQQAPAPWQDVSGGELGDLPGACPCPGCGQGWTGPSLPLPVPPGRSPLCPGQRALGQPGCRHWGLSGEPAASLPAAGSSMFPDALCPLIRHRLRPAAMAGAPGPAWPGGWHPPWRASRPEDCSGWMEGCDRAGISANSFWPPHASAGPSAGWPGARCCCSPGSWQQVRGSCS